MYDFLEQANLILREAGELGGIDPAVIDLLSGPSRLMAFRIPLKMDDGRRRIFEAYRVSHNRALGPSRDGTRISPTIDLDEVKALGLLMSIKHAAGHIPAGGGKGGIAANRRELSEAELERLCRAYIRRLRSGGGPAFDVPGADIGTDLQTMSWMLDEYEEITGGHAPAAINDKPPILGGSLGGYEATGRGVFDVFREVASEEGWDLDGLRVAIQGFGQVGAVAATCFEEAGCRIVAVSDSRGAIYGPEGLDVAALQTHKEETGRVSSYPDAEAIGNDELLTCDCDVLVPAAVQGVVTADNAPRVRAWMIVEAANGPITVEADRLLRERGVTIVPDILANAGSVQVCQMERSQGLYENWWDAETIERLRRERLVRAYREAAETAARHTTDSLRLGAWINALERIGLAVHQRGWL
ncbi:MAG: Glu/Leu/Phe/Val family dehydrogenase [Myxococcota bacterium]